MSVLSGVYVSPILPCGNSLSGPMVETLTGKPLLKGSSKYFVYQHTSPQTASIVPEHVWRPLQTEVTDAFAAADPVNAGYLAYVAPKVCVSEKQYKKCLSFVSKKKRPFNLGKEENDLCSFVIMHQGLFLEVDGKADGSPLSCILKASSSSTCRSKRVLKCVSY